MIATSTTLILIRFMLYFLTLRYLNTAATVYLADWVVGKSDFNENPVVSLDFDLGFVNILPTDL